jgi:hypothetical protein
MPFEIIGEITDIETFATGSGIRELARLRKFYGRGPWRKRNGVARVRLPDGGMRLAELHCTKLTESDAESLKSNATLTEALWAH